MSDILRPEVAHVRDLVVTLFQALVDHEDEVRVNTLAGRHHIIFEVSVDPRDVHFAIGSGGSHADAVRLIVRAQCKKSKLRFDLQVLEDRTKRRS
jgi:predicted RNA-binding protein YlqC (UPF0109 family)